MIETVKMQISKIDFVCEDQQVFNPKEKFKVETFIVIIDQIIISLNQRFSKNNTLNS